MEGFFSYIQHQFKWLDRPNKWVCSNVWQVPTSMQLVLETDEVESWFWKTPNAPHLHSCTNPKLEEM